MTTKPVTSQGRSGVRETRECPCSRVVRDVFLCPSCVDRLEDLVVQGVGLLRDLAVTMARLDQLASGVSVKVQGQSRVLPIRLDASSAAAELRRRLQITTSRPLGEWAVSDEGPSILDGLEVAVGAAIRVVDLPPELIHIGACGKIFEGVECEQELFVTADQTTITCEVCGTLWDVRDRRETAIQSAWKVIAPPKVVAEALATQGVRVTPKHIENWQRLGHLERAVDPASGVSGFRVSDVFVVARRMEARKRKRHAQRV